MDKKDDGNNCVNEIIELWKKASGRKMLKKSEMHEIMVICSYKIPLLVIKYAIEMWVDDGKPVGKWKIPFIWIIRKYIDKAWKLYKRNMAGKSKIKGGEEVSNVEEIEDPILRKLFKKQAKALENLDYGKAYDIENEICDRAWELADKNLREEAIGWVARKVKRLSKGWNPSPEEFHQFVMRGAKRYVRKKMGIPYLEGITPF